MAIFQGAHGLADLHTAFKLPYLCDYVTKLCKQQVILNHKNRNDRNNGHGEPRHSKYERLKFRGGQAYDRSSAQPAVVA
jgi:hypothetical protein